MILHAKPIAGPSANRLTQSPLVNPPRHTEACHTEAYHTEGYHTESCHKSQSHEKSCCQRPGCYERFPPAPRSPMQTFCCRKALCAVLIRERRWFAKLKNTVIRTRDGPLYEPCKTVLSNREVTRKEPQ